VKRLFVGIVTTIALVGVLFFVIASIALSRSDFYGGVTYPSHDEVLRGVEHYYAHNGNDSRRPRGELAGCPTRYIMRMFHCEFDYPTVETPRQITCVNIGVLGPNTWEQSRRVIWEKAIAKARPQAKKFLWPSVCG
jgi:hypothetical protein